MTLQTALILSAKFPFTPSPLWEYFNRNKSKPMKNQKQTLSIVRQAYDDLEFLNNKTWTRYRDNLLAECVAEEKSHRGFMSEFNRSHPNASGVTDCAKSFAVKRVAEYLTGTKFPRGKDFLHIQRSCFYAAGLVDEFRKEIRKAWRKHDLKALCEIDYVKLVSPEEN